MQKLALSQKLSLRFSPQQIQLMRLLQVPTMSIEQRIEQELEENPALELLSEEPERPSNGDEEPERDEDLSRDTSDFDINDYLDEDDVATYKLKANNHSPDDEYRETPLTEAHGFQDFLTDQMMLLDLDETQQIIGETIIGNLDGNGYLSRTIEAMVNDLAFTQNVYCQEADIQHVLEAVQSLDPPGIAARNLQECLTIQIKRLEHPDERQDLALAVLDKGFEDFVMRRYERLIQRFEIDEARLKSILQLIEGLNPKPGNLYGDNVRNPHIIPDFIIQTENDRIDISLNQRNAPELTISREYSDMLETYAETSKKSKQQHDAVQFITHKIDAARHFIEAIQQRQNTLMRTMDAITQVQRAYFLSGDISDLKPMRLQDIADIIGMDISTVSRVVNSKYAQTPFGTVFLRDLFTNAVNADSGAETSSAEVKAKIAELIADEDKSKPWTDEELVEKLAPFGFKLARRTVAKYREALALPVARLRKAL